MEEGNRVPLDSEELSDGGNRVPLDSEELSDGGNRVPLGSEELLDEGNRVPLDSEELSDGGNRVPLDREELSDGGNPLNYGKEHRKNSVFINSWSISWNTFKDLFYFFCRIVENYFGFQQCFLSQIVLASIGTYGHSGVRRHF